MNRETVMALAHKAGLHLATDVHWMPIIDLAYAEKFAALVAAHEVERIKQANAPEIEKINAYIKALEEAVLAEREECAKVCEEYESDMGHGIPQQIAEAIRSRTNES